jgi:hypothetical protein
VCDSTTAPSHVPVSSEGSEDEEQQEKRKVKKETEDEKGRGRKIVWVDER